MKFPSEADGFPVSLPSDMHVFSDTEDGFTSVTFTLPDHPAYARIGPRLFNRPSADGENWELVPEPGDVVEFEGLFVSPGAPKRTGLQLYKTAIQAIREVRATSLYARVHNARIIRIMQRVHGDLPVFLTQHPQAPVEVYGFKEAVAGDYGEGLCPQEAISYLEEGADIDGFNEARYLEAFIAL